MWNAVDYFKELAWHLNMTRAKYAFCRVTGLNNLEDILAKQTKYKAFIAVEDNQDGATIRRNGGGYFNRRSVVVYILKKFDTKSQISRETALNETRLIYQKMIAKLISDSSKLDDLVYLDKTRISFHEVPGMFAAETCGLYFLITLDEPISLISDENDFDSSIVFDPSFDQTFG